MDSFTNFTSSLEIPHFIPIPPIYSVVLLMLSSLLLIYFPKLDFIFTFILLIEILLLFSKKLKSKMLLINEIKLFTFYFILLTSLSIINYIFLFLYKIIPILYSIKFIFLLYLTANLQLLDFMENILTNLDSSIKSKKITSAKIQKSFKDAQSIVNEKMKEVKKEINEERKDM